MAVTIIELTSTTVVHKATANATAENDVRSGATTLYGYFIDNNGTDAPKAYLKLYDALAPTIGTTDPDWIFDLEGTGTGDSQKLNDGQTFVVLNGGTGISFATALSLAVVTAGGTGGTTDPTVTLNVTLITN